MKAIVLVLTLISFYHLKSMAIEEPAFTIEKKYESFEIRKYDTVVVAQLQVDEKFEEAGNKAFRVLADYIFGNNRSKTKIAMTAPVTQQSEKIAMTAPVNVKKSGSGHVVQFVLPASYTLETAPQPVDERVILAEIPARRVAVYSYSGSWSESRYQSKLSDFLKLIEAESLQIKGEPIFARFNSPFQLWFLRRNEIWIELE